MWTRVEQKYTPALLLCRHLIVCFSGSGLWSCPCGVYGYRITAQCKELCGVLLYHSTYRLYYKFIHSAHMRCCRAAFIAIYIHVYLLICNKLLTYLLTYSALVGKYSRGGDLFVCRVGLVWLGLGTYHVLPIGVYAGGAS